MFPLSTFRRHFVSDLTAAVVLALPILLSGCPAAGVLPESSYLAGIDTTAPSIASLPDGTYTARASVDVPLGSIAAVPYAEVAVTIVDHAYASLPLPSRRARPASAPPSALRQPAWRTAWPRARRGSRHPDSCRSPAGFPCRRRPRPRGEAGAAWSWCCRSVSAVFSALGPSSRTPAARSSLRCTAAPRRPPLRCTGASGWGSASSA